MPDPLNPTELLTNAKPTNTYEIEAARLDEMISRVISVSPANRLSIVLGTWQMRAGSAVAVAAVAVTSVVVALSGGPPGLPVLALGSHTTVAGAAQHAAIVPSAGNFATVQGPQVPGAPSKSTRFVAGPRLTTAAASLAVYHFSAVPDPSNSVASIASALGLSDAVTTRNCHWNRTGTFNAVAAKGVVVASSYVATRCQSVSSASSEPLTWTYNLKSFCPEPSSLSQSSGFTCAASEVPAEHGASKVRLVQWSSPLVRSLNAGELIPQGLSLAKPTFADGTNIIYYPLVASNNVPSDQYVEFQFSDHGALLYATGPLGSTSLDNTYPLVSEAKGVTLLQSAAATSTTINPGGPMIPAPPATTTFATLNVTLSAATLSYELVWLSDGSALLVPQYTYRASSGVNQRVLALKPTFYRVQTTK